MMQQVQMLNIMLKDGDGNPHFFTYFFLNEDKDLIL